MAKSDKEVTTEVKETAKPKTKTECRKELMRLIRCRITNNNPNKQVLDGEVITVINPLISRLSRFIPFNKECTHIENVLYMYLKDKKYCLPQLDKNGHIFLKELPEYTIEILPNLTKEELEALAKAQRVRSNDEELGTN